MWARPALLWPSFGSFLWPYPSCSAGTRYNTLLRPAQKKQWIAHRDREGARARVRERGRERESGCVRESGWERERERESGREWESFMRAHTNTKKHYANDMERKVLQKKNIEQMTWSVTSALAPTNPPPLLPVTPPTPVPLQHCSSHTIAPILSDVNNNFTCKQ